MTNIIYTTDMALNNKELLYVYNDLHNIFHEDLHIARPLIQILQQREDIEKARELAMEMARRMLASGLSSEALVFLEICKRLKHPQKEDIEAMATMALMTLGGQESTTNHNFSLIAQLSDSEGVEFIQQGALESFKKGAPIVKQGDVGDRFYLILQGHVSVHLQTKDGQTMQVTSLAPGDFFGEYACIYKLPRSASVDAMEDTLLLSFSGFSITMLMEVSIEAGEELLQVIQTRMVQSMSHGHPAFLELAQEDRKWLSEESTILELNDSKPLDTDAMHHCCVILHGSITVTWQHDGHEKQYTLNQFDMFGSVHAALTLPHDAILMPSDHCLLCCIPSFIFQSFTSAYPNFETWVVPHGEKRQHKMGMGHTKLS